MAFSKSKARPDTGDLYQRITDQIVAQLEKGVRPWQRPWDGNYFGGANVRPVRANGERYKGINVLTLWSEGALRGYSSNMWMTYKQAPQFGGNVRKDEKGVLVVYASKFKKESRSDTGETVENIIPFLKGYTVFNVEQIDGLPERFHGKQGPKTTVVERVAHAEEFFRNVGADIRHGGNKAYYIPSADHIQMPLLESFHESQGYYSTLAHETTHWTNHKSRLDRDMGVKRFGDEGYAMEELVAELGAAFLCADLELVSKPRPNHASYIASWLKVLKNDKRAVFTAASYAQRAIEFLNSKQPQHEEEFEDEEAELDIAA
jgi:antirestriction protein ArdC